MTTLRIAILSSREQIAKNQIIILEITMMVYLNLNLDLF